MAALIQAGSRNLITDVGGLAVGHAADERLRSGVTVIACDQAWPAAVDVRGGGPGTRETDVLSPENLVGRVHAVVFAGGSVFGLAAADGVVNLLSSRGIGLALRAGTPAIPIVPAAVLYDLADAGGESWGHEPPYRELGMQALRSAGLDFALGSVGAGRGAIAGVQKGGVGSTSVDLGNGLLVGALAAVNSAGSALMPDGRTYWAWGLELDHEFRAAPPAAATVADSGWNIGNPFPDESRLRSLGRLALGANTTLGVVACSARLTTAECKRVAMMAQDGIARALRPAHTPFDGDTVFAIASGEVLLEDGPRALHLARVGAAAADCLARAIVRAVAAAAQDSPPPIFVSPP